MTGGSIPGCTRPITRAATRPSRSITTVLGSAAGGTPRDPRQQVRALVDHAGVGQGELLHHGSGILAAVVDVDPDERDLVAVGRPGELRQLGQFLLARLAPGSPRVQHHDPAAQVREVECIPGQRRAPDLRCRPAVGCCERLEPEPASGVAHGSGRGSCRSGRSTRRGMVPAATGQRRSREQQDHHQLAPSRPPSHAGRPTRPRSARRPRGCAAPRWRTTRRRRSSSRRNRPP